MSADARSVEKLCTKACTRNTLNKKHFSGKMPSVEQKFGHQIVRAYYTSTDCDGQRTSTALTVEVRLLKGWARELMSSSTALANDSMSPTLLDASGNAVLMGNLRRRCLKVQLCVSRESPLFSKADVYATVTFRRYTIRKRFVTFAKGSDRAGGRVRQI